ncbi:hypothetical protein INT47_007548 [Mucor saturninus]|uniref:Uncharacterized protein n=1 Tax=Mucor saturninus TaxID=64648 RepID=A0A8H7R4Y0_9FUNG|nr:hypothetical protein INT47_007548 [Mucor saturninus]
MTSYQAYASTSAVVENSSEMNIQGQESSTLVFSMDTLHIEEGQVTSGPTGFSGPDATQIQKGNVGPSIKNNPPTFDELDEDAELIKLYLNRIKKLHKAQLMSDDFDTLTKNYQLIVKLNLSMKELKPKINNNRK